MAKDVIMPALGMAQETGTLIQWLKAPGAVVARGEPLMEIETDKATVEIEAPADGTLAGVSAQAGDVIPVGERIAVILAAGETWTPAPASASSSGPAPATPIALAPASRPAAPVSATPVAARMAAEHNLDLAAIKAAGGVVRKEDVRAHLAAQPAASGNNRLRASPKARRLAQQHGLVLGRLRGSGPDGAILAGDVLAAASAPAPTAPPSPSAGQPMPEAMGTSRLWRIMAERVTQAWTTIPHFYLVREADASGLVAWYAEARQRSTARLTYTDLLVRLVAAALRQHPRLNATWNAAGNAIVSNPDINVGLAVAVDDGLVVPVIHHADQLGLSQLAGRRAELVAKAQAGKLAPADISGGTFTVSNLGMFGVDVFNPIINPPQAAILAVGRVADRVIPVDGQPAIRPMVTFSLACDHRVVDGARGGQFLNTLADLVAMPMRLLD
jgi:pyruvate dehydrogenase E2 component (dihydrolipoamide acetyltransferase)